MNSNQDKFKRNLQYILKDLDNHKRDKSTLLEYYINLRLEKSLNSYCEDLNKSYESLVNKNSMNLIKRINRL